jgi:hypothetical protein
LALFVAGETVAQRVMMSNASLAEQCLDDAAVDTTF